MLCCCKIFYQCTKESMMAQEMLLRYAISITHNRDVPVKSKQVSTFGWMWSEIYAADIQIINVLTL